MLTFNLFVYMNSILQYYYGQHLTFGKAPDEPEKAYAKKLN